MIILQKQSSKDQAARYLRLGPRIPHCGANGALQPHRVSMAEEACGRAVRAGVHHPSHAASTSLMFSLLLCPGVSSSIRCDFGYRPRLSSWDPQRGMRMPGCPRDSVRDQRAAARQIYPGAGLAAFDSYKNIPRPSPEPPTLIAPIPSLPASSSSSLVRFCRPSHDIQLHQICGPT